MISEMILRVRRLNQQCHTTEGYRLVNHLKSQSLEAQLTIRQEKDVTKKKLLHMNTEETDTLGR